MSWSDLPLLLMLPVLALVSGFCAASETALFSLTHTDRQRLRRISPAADRIVRRLMAAPRRLLLVILLLTNAANVAYFVVAAILELRLGGRLAFLAFSIGSLLALILLADLVPKLLARRLRVRTATLVARPLAAAAAFLSPVVGVMERWLVGPLVRLVRPTAAPAALDPDELQAVLELSTRSGAIDVDDQQMLSDVVLLGQTRVRDVMTPRTLVKWIDGTATAQAVRAAIAAARRDQIPVFAGSLDGKAMGVLDVRAYVLGAGDLARALRPALFVPERARLDDAFESLRARGHASALVVDEFGALVGILSMSDLVKQIAAPIREAELAGQTAGPGPIVRLRGDAWSVPGRLPLRTLRDFLGEDLALRQGGPSTIAGLVLQRLGRLARVGDRVATGGLELVVSEMTGRTVTRIEMRVRGPAAQGAAP